jgi:hypothetical protein
LVVGGRFGVVVDAGERDHVQRPVELAVAAAVQSAPALLSAGGVEGAGTGERGEGRFACHPVGVAAGDEQLRGADRSDAAFGEQGGGDLAEDLEESAIHLHYLVAQSLGPPRKPVQDGVADIRARSQPSRRSREPLTAERPKALGQMLGSGDDERAQLVEGGRARLDGDSTLEQEQAQLFAPSTTARKAEPLAVSSRRAANAASIKSLLPRRRSWRRGRSHSQTVTPARSRKRTSPAP